MLNLRGQAKSEADFSCSDFLVRKILYHHECQRHRKHKNKHGISTSNPIFIVNVYIQIGILCTGSQLDNLPLTSKQYCTSL